MAIREVAEECVPYINGFISDFEVKQICLHLFETERVLVHSVDPLTFWWREGQDHKA